MRRAVRRDIHLFRGRVANGSRFVVQDASCCGVGRLHGNDSLGKVKDQITHVGHAVAPRTPACWPPRVSPRPVAIRAGKRQRVREYATMVGALCHTRVFPLPVRPPVEDCMERVR